MQRKGDNQLTKVQAREIIIGAIERAGGQAKSHLLELLTRNIASAWDESDEGSTGQLALIVVDHWRRGARFVTNLIVCRVDVYSVSAEFVNLVVRNIIPQGIVSDGLEGARFNRALALAGKPLRLRKDTPKVLKLNKKGKRSKK